MNKPTTIIHLLSGGMDSTVMLYDLHGEGNKVHAVLFDYKQKHVQELQWAIHHCRRLNVLWSTIEVSQLRGSTLTDGTGGVVVQGRNAALLSLAINLATAAGAEIITYACNKDDQEVFVDCRPSFVKAFNDLQRAQGIQIEVCAPYIDKSKWWIAGRGREIGIDLSQTWSCYKGGIEPCGECPACVKRKEALDGHGGK